MYIIKKMIALIVLVALMNPSTSQLEAVTYVTDTGGYAYDEARAATNLAPAIALGTVAIVGIIAIAVQNSHDHSSSSFCHYGCQSSSGYSPYYSDSCFSSISLSSISSGSSSHSCH